MADKVPVGRIAGLEANSKTGLRSARKRQPPSPVGAGGFPHLVRRKTLAFRPLRTLEHQTDYSGSEDEGSSLLSCVLSRWITARLSSMSVTGVVTTTKTVMTTSCRIGFDCKMEKI